MEKRIMLFLTCLLLGAGLSMAQVRRVTGVVISAEDNEPIIGASVLVKGTTVGAVTDMDGAFIVENVPSGAKTLMVSYVGMRTKEVAIAAKVEVVLVPEAEQLDEVVVTAQGLTRKDKSIGYAAQKVDGEKLQLARQTDLGNALAGKIAGARFLGGSGASFDDGRIVLRGTNNFGSPQGSEPIYVVDGTITNKNAVNMDDVASINVLKGAAATALYGSQGGNGAVIITTKGATVDDGKGHLEVSHTLQFESPYNHFKVQKLYGGGSLGGARGQVDGMDPANANVDTMSPEYLFGKYGGKIGNAYTYDMYSDESWGPRYDANVLVHDPLSLDGVRGPKGWTHGMDLSDLYRTGVTNTTNVAFSKSGRDYNTRISFTSTDRQGVQYNSGALRRFLTAKSTFKPTSWMNVTLDYKYTYRKTKNAAGTGYESMYSEYTQWGQTNVNLKDYLNNYIREDGTIRTWNNTSATNNTAMFHDNPYAIMKENNYVSTYSWNVISGDVEVLLPYNLKAGFRVNASLRNSFIEDKIPAGLTNYGTSRYYEQQNHLSDITLQGRLTWNQHFMSDRLSVDAALFGEERQYHYGQLIGQTQSGLAIPNFFQLSNSNDPVSASNSKTEYITRGLYGTVTAGLDDTYFLDASLRNDWDSRLSKEKNNYLYGALSASVMLNNIVAKDSKWLNYWKLRASLAQVGSTLGAYALSDYFSTSKYNNKITLYNRTTQINQSIKPTISTSYEVGTEFRMFNNRFWGDVNFYTIDTKNQILNLPVAYQSGYANRQINAGLIRNAGIEVSLGVTPVKTRNFQWDVEANFAHNSNKLVELGEGLKLYSLGYNSFGAYKRWYTYAVEGQPVGTLYVGGFFKRDAQGRLILAPTSSAAWGGGYMPQSEVKTPEQQLEEGHYAGNYQPDLTGGFSTNLRYKQFTLGLNFDFLIGGKVASWTNMYAETSGTGISSAKINDRGVNEREPVAKGGGVHVTGVDLSGNPVDTYLNAYQWYQTKANDAESYMYDRTYVKLREISLAYQFSRSQLQKWTKGFINSASLSLIATNPWLIYSAVPNVDASEISTTSTNAYAQSIEDGSTISTRSVGFTVKLGF